VGDGRLLLLHHQEILAFYLASDAYVMNSQGRGETFGRVTIEAMAFGLSVLGSFGGGTVEIVKEGEAGQARLSANILRLAQDRALAKRLGDAGRRRAEEHFSARRFHRDMAAIIENTPGILSD
jgi:glycosyltransferase involved in cell wall biosynthesis